MTTEGVFLSEFLSKFSIYCFHFVCFADVAPCTQHWSLIPPWVGRSRRSVNFVLMNFRNAGLPDDRSLITGIPQYLTPQIGIRAIGRARWNSTAQMNVSRISIKRGIKVS